MAQPAPNMIILYVASAPASEAFYSKVLGMTAIESSPGFAMFALGYGMMLGLWTKAGVEPAATAPGGVELGFPMADDAALDALHAKWKADGLKIVQPPVTMDFGYTFTAEDPDGHRLRAIRAEM